MWGLEIISARKSRNVDSFDVRLECSPCTKTRSFLNIYRTWDVKRVYKLLQTGTKREISRKCFIEAPKCRIARFESSISVPPRLNIFTLALELCHKIYLGPHELWY